LNVVTRIKTAYEYTCIVGTVYDKVHWLLSGYKVF